MRKHLLFTLLILPFLLQAQVSLVKDINPVGGGVALYPNNRIEFNGELLFAADDDTNGMELWKSDGTETGTVLLHAINFSPSAAASGNPKNFYEFNGQVYYNSSRTNVGTELFSTNGSVPSFYPEINLFGNADPKKIFEFNNSLFFSATVGDINSNFYGEELLGFDGNAWTGSVANILIKDINTSTISANSNHSSSPNNFVELFGEFIFSAADAASGNNRELWISDGTNSGTQLLLDINFGTSSSNPTELIVFNNKIYFSADDGVNGRELWVTDGTVAGTQLVQDLFPGGSGNPTGLTVYNNFLIFTAINPGTGIEAFKMTTAENITLLQNINPGSGSSTPFGYTVFNGELYFAADNGSGIELWKSGGFPSNTNLVADINPTGESTPQGFTEYNGKLYFNADNGVNGRELWVTDGTTAGTEIVDDIWPGTASSDPLDLIVANNELFFSANDGSTGYELWKYVDPTLSNNENTLQSAQIRLYPNPIDSEFIIESTIPVLSVSILNLQGQIVKRFDSEMSSYSMETLNSGIYFAQIETENGITNKQVIKN